MKYPDGVKLIQVPCSSRVDPAFIIKAIMDGADGVFVAGCHPGDCHFIKGNYFTRRKVAALKEMFDAFGMKDKLRLFWVSAAEARRFVEKVTGMYNEIKERKNAGKTNVRTSIEGQASSEPGQPPAALLLEGATQPQ